LTEDEARALAEFVRDHDKRFVASVVSPEGGEGAAVRLERADDGTPLDPLRSAEQYHAEHVAGGPDPGPTVASAWEAWRRERER
jgi:hypothetical protein